MRQQRRSGEGRGREEGGEQRRLQRAGVVWRGPLTLLPRCLPSPL